MADSSLARVRRPRGALGFIRRVVVTVLGVTVLLAGVVMVVLPGPAVLVIPAGLAILATEYVWAGRLLARVKAQARALTQRLQRPAQPG